MLKLTELIVAAMIKLDLDEQHTIGELLHNLRKTARPKPACSCKLDISLCMLHWKNDPALQEDNDE
jgi:hypothetical protein